MNDNLSLYKIFYVVAKSGNISHAAKQLYISQPAISKSIIKLEENLKTTLFYRSSRGVTLTKEGEVLYKHINQAFDLITQGEEQLYAIRQLDTQQIRIGVSTTLCKYMLLPYLKQFIETYPYIKLIIYCQPTLQTIKLLEENIIDIGLIGKTKLRNLEFLSLQEIEDTFVLAPSYLEQLTISDPNIKKYLFQHANLMLLDEENISRIYIDNYLKQHSHLFESSKILEINNMELLIEFAKIGIGISCVIKQFIEPELNHNQLVEVPLQVKIPKRQVGFAYVKQPSITEAVEKFISFYIEKFHTSKK